MRHVTPSPAAQPPLQMGENPQLAHIISPFIKNHSIFFPINHTPKHLHINSDYSQLTQSTFSTPPGLTSTAQKTYSGSPNLPQQDLGIIISAILSLIYNIPHRASCILNPSLNLLIKYSISSSGGHPTPAFHIPQDLSTIFEHLQLEPVIQNYIGCPQCFFINGLTESVKTDQPHCQCHNDTNDNDPPCTQSLGKLINSFEPRTQKKTNMKQNVIPTKHSIYQPYFSRRLELWKLCIKINNPEFPKAPQM
ncbi:hypothetical protein O181_019549 [Austropuccinia psidii MF-1]|uniref:Uncharacterized protein n=1 Tax=Austropuccinia psidii MF-1 TaxID=1389203 RepID=A0A9Q3C7B1_9BASI|nr:hypothetical protein [Austropuccinia psidii MF-1]